MIEPFLREEAILAAAHDLYCVSVDNVLEGRRPREWEEFRDGIDPLPDHEQLWIMGNILGQVREAWGVSVGLVLHHADLLGTQQSALYYLIMGCLGHGVTLEDDYGDDLDVARERLGRPLSGAPIDLDDDPWREFAERYFEPQSA